MTSTLTAPDRHTLITTCTKTWCLAGYGCTNDRLDTRIHEGRYSSFSGTFRGGEIHVAPTEFENPYADSQEGPLIEISLNSNGRRSLGLDPQAALKFADTIAEYAAEMVEVGTEATFKDHPGTVVATVKRLNDVVFEYGNAAPRYGSFGAVEVTIRETGEDKPDLIGLDAPTAAHFARSIAAAVREVTR